MTDPFGNMQGFMNKFKGFMNNPMQFMMQSKLNIPQEYQNDPNGAIQYLMNSGQLSQAQYNEANRMAKQIQNNPMFQQMMGNMGNRNQ